MKYYFPAAALISIATLVVVAAAAGQAPASAEVSIQRADESWAEAVAAKSIEQTVASYDREILTAGFAMPPARGIAEIRAMWTSLFADPDFTMSWKADEVVVIGTGALGYSSGIWRGGGQTGPYLAVWRKQGDGSWKVLMDAAWFSAYTRSRAESPEFRSPGAPGAIWQADEACLAALAAKSLEREVACYDADGLFVQNGAVLARGTADIRNMLSKFFSDPSFDFIWKAEQRAVGAAGNLGYSAGTWRDGGETGPYFAVWQKQPDGKWTLLIDCTWTLQPRE